MRNYLRFPTHTRFGWLAFLVLFFVIAIIQDEVFKVNGVLARLLGLIGLVLGTACMIEFFDHYTESPHDREEITDRLSKSKVRHHKKYSLKEILQILKMIILCILGILSVLFIYFIAAK